MRIKHVLSWLAFIAVLVGLAIGVSNLQEITDWLRLRNYHPSAQIAGLASDDTMRAGTRRVFYINHPELDGKLQFNGHCRTEAEQTIVLGCYIENQGIYLLKVDDKRLDGVLQVTAAHETLHAMYARLSKQERAKVDKMTASFFATLKDDRIRKTVEGYRAKDPGVVPNELHSILGTEVRDLSPELENYYKQYFSDRSKIVDYSDKYEKSFIDIESKAGQYDASLSALKRKISADESRINLQLTAINEKQKELDNLKAQNDIEGYNSQVPVYNSMIKEYNSLVNQTKQEINEYNSLLSVRNNLVLQQQQLYQEINSNSINTK